MSFVVLAPPYLLQLLCIIHVVRAGRNTSGIWLIIFLPRVGGTACPAVEVLEHTETDRAKVVGAYAQQRRRFGSFEFDGYCADFPARGRPRDRPWMRRVLRLRATIGDGKVPGRCTRRRAGAFSPRAAR